MAIIPAFNRKYFIKQFILPGARRKHNVIVILIIAFCAVAVLSPLCQAGSKRPATQDPYVINNRRYYPIPNAEGYRETGIASWYGTYFHGRQASSGERYNMYEMTAAHKTLPMNTMLLVKNMENDRTTVVRVNDRGPFVKGRIIDLSYKAGKVLGIINNGTARVEITALAEGRIPKGGGAPALVHVDLMAGEFYVQIAAFAKKINAIKLQKRFTDAGHTTVIQKYFSPESTLYRVQVYAGKTLQNARKAEKALLEHGYIGSFIVAR